MCETERVYVCTSHYETLGMPVALAYSWWDTYLAFYRTRAVRLWILHTQLVLRFAINESNMKVSVYFIGARQLHMLKAEQNRDRKCSTTELSRPCGRHFHKSQRRFVSNRAKFEINNILGAQSLNSSNRAGIFRGALLHVSLEQKADRCIRTEAKPASDDHHKIAPRTKQENSPITSQFRKFSSSQDRGAYCATPRVSATASSRRSNSQNATNTMLRRKNKHNVGFRRYSHKERHTQDAMLERHPGRMSACSC
jgi:hypothetical protein